MKRFIAKTFNNFKQEWHTQNDLNLIIELTPFTKKFVAFTSVTGFLLGGWFGASKSRYENERKGSIVAWSLIGTIIGTCFGMFWTISPIIIGVPYGLYKTVEFATRPTEEELKN
jgi:hypothetical protein